METLKFILLFIWQLPQNIVAVLMLPFLGKKTRLGRKRYCNYYLCEGMRGKGSISLGSFIFLGTDRETTIGHELGHVVDSHRLGIFYLLVVGIPSLMWAAAFFSGDYYAFYTEQWANAHSHLHSENVGGGYYLLQYDEGYSLDDIR